MTRGKRGTWGGVRKLPSGRFQAHYRIGYQRYIGPHTFRTKTEAEAFLAATRVDFERGVWVDPNASKVTLGEYSTTWLSQRQVRPRTCELYAGLFRLHLLPTFGHLSLRDVTSSRVRQWHADLLAKGTPGPPTVAKCYRLFHAVFETALQDDLIPKNPCVLRSASAERPPERPIATVAQIFELADAIERQFRAMVLLGTITGLRLGELRALRCDRLDLLHRRVHVVEQYQQLSDGTQLLGPPKTAAGVRRVAIPEAIVPDLEEHLRRFAEPDGEGLVFTGTRRQPVRIATFYAAWGKATRSVGMSGFRFHDLRHTGNTLAAASGASLKELMTRMGHASPRAALIYQHATENRDEAIAAALSETIRRSPRVRRTPVIELRRREGTDGRPRP
jgi:integrase